MAPTKPHKRTSIRTKTPSTTPATVTNPLPAAIPIKPTKKHKLVAKHASFISKIESKSKIQKPTPRSATSRSRKAKAVRESLGTGLGLGSLADALQDESLNFSNKLPVGIGSVSLASKPGTMKKKEKVVRSECERFGKNMAVMAIGGGSAGGGTWAALRGFIEGSMERKEEFLKRT